MTKEQVEKLIADVATCMTRISWHPDDENAHLLHYSYDGLSSAWGYLRTYLSKVDDPA